jgi:hypothetical protein
MHPQITVDTARRLSHLDVLDREVAEITAVPIGTIRKWRTGARRGARQARRADCPRCTGRPLNEPAYSYLLGLYLGDGYITRGHRDVYALSIACCDDWPGLLAAAKSAMSAVMPASKVLGVQRIGMTEVKSYSKHWPCLFPQHGPGRKHTRKIELAEWQRVIVERYPGDFARGRFTRTDTGASTECAGPGAGVWSAGMSTRGTCSPTTRRTSCGSAGRH